MRKKWKWIIQGLFLVVVVSMTIFAVLSKYDLNEFIRELRVAETGWFIPGVVLVVLFICSESLILHILMKGLGVVHKGLHCILYSFIGFFFSCITPSAGGGQPMQVYFMRKDKISASKSVPILISVTIMYKAVLLVYAFGVLILGPKDVLDALSPVKEWCFLGFFLNVLVISFYILLIMRPNLVKSTLLRVLRLLKAFIKENKYAQLQEKIENWIQQYRETSECIKEKSGLVIPVLLISIVQRTILFSVTYLALRAFGYTSLNYYVVIILQAMICMGTDLLPLPGGTGASDLMFYMIYEPILGESGAFPVLLVSRGIAYYGQIIISAVMTGIAALRVKRKESK